MRKRIYWVYLMTDSTLPGYFKIGYSGSLDYRARQLDCTVNRCFPFGEFKAKKLELAIHEYLTKIGLRRKNARPGDGYSEWYKLDGFIYSVVIQWLLCKYYDKLKLGLPRYHELLVDEAWGSVINHLENDKTSTEKKRERTDELCEERYQRMLTKARI